MIAGKKLRFSQSIAIQVLIPMVVIGLLALASMLISLLVTLNTQHDAEAINIAGSMRMQSYRIAVLLQQPNKDMSEIKIAEALTKEHQLFSQKLYQSSISKAAKKVGRGGIKQRYDEVVDNWEKNIVPIFSTIMSGSSISTEQISDASNRYLSQVDDHVDKINSLVLSIQQNTE